MRNKSTLLFCSLILACSFTLSTSAQQNKKKKSTDFDLEIVKYSNRADMELEHYHLLTLTNNSNKQTNYKLSSKPSVKCKMDRKNIVSSKFSAIDSEDSQNKNTIDEKRSVNFEIKIYNENRDQEINQVSLSPNESINIYAKITRLSNSNPGSWECNKISARLLGDKKEKRVKKSVKIPAFIPNPNNRGH